MNIRLGSETVCHIVNRELSAGYSILSQVGFPAIKWTWLPGGVLCHKVNMTLQDRDRRGSHVERK